MSIARSRFGWVVIVACVAVLLGNGRATAGGKFLGETVIHLGDGGHEAWMIGKSQDVGYKYSYVAFLWIDLWSWGGTYCVHQRFEHSYTPITHDQAAKLLGVPPAELRPPFWYRYPAGLIFFGPFLLLAIVQWVRKQLVKPPTEANDSPAAPAPAGGSPPTPPTAD